MADFQADLDAALMGYGGLTALIGSRLYPNSAPPDVVCPYIIMYEFATPRAASFGDPAAVSKPRIQYSIYAKGYGAAKDVADQLRAALSATSWPIVLEDERGNRDATSGIYRRDLDVRITHVGA
jgi:hypothetical protein